MKGRDVFGVQDITDELLKASRAAFRREVVREVSALVGRLERLNLNAVGYSAGESVDVPALLKIANPEVITDELLELSTNGERFELFRGLVRSAGLPPCFEWCANLPNFTIGAEELATLKAAVITVIGAEEGARE